MVEKTGSVQADLSVTGSNEFQAGIFLIDKPVGPTSFRVVQQVRRALGIKKVGHAGTLDPCASGLLVVCVGRSATRIISSLVAGEKEYEATLKLGVTTDTLDMEGKIVEQRPVGSMERAKIEICLAGFVGEQQQVPPQFSAVKHKGKPLYHYARKGIEIVKEPRRIEITKIDCLEVGDDATVTFRVACSKGTYIRVLAADIGESLGCGAHLIALRRLRSGPFRVEDALPGLGLLDKDPARALLLEHLLTVEDVLGSI
ncbi:MAG: tRNA pseudouridine(55) synthase TruB [Proteobacteria bacterium]|nr:tRNA pseudouridine(55) synthase TruB [Pseudomonadota bacterium]MBU1716200.1 tRNA pseudouridine(55) synthase TruB [Pseudomonadota bacterium]